MEPPYQSGRLLGQGAVGEDWAVHFLRRRRLPADAADFGDHGAEALRLGPGVGQRREARKLVAQRRGRVAAHLGGESLVVG